MEKMSIISIVSAFPIMVGLGFDNVGEIFGVGGAIVFGFIIVRINLKSLIKIGVEL